MYAIITAVILLSASLYMSAQVANSVRHLCVALAKLLTIEHPFTMSPASN